VKIASLLRIKVNFQKKYLEFYTKLQSKKISTEEDTYFRDVSVMWDQTTTITRLITKTIKIRTTTRVERS
jgi:hypothetical protein